MKVLMFGWEFPPFKSGGLGTACYGLTKALSQLGVSVVFVIPKAPYKVKGKYVNLVIGNQLKKLVKTVAVDSILSPYHNEQSYMESYLNYKGFSGASYGSNLFDEVERYAKLAEEIALKYDFDIIHAHDWLSAKAGMAAKRVTHKPLILQIHATEFDRTGGNPNPYIYKIEREGMEYADKVIAVSNYTKRIIVEKYGIPESKVAVVHNAIDVDSSPPFNDDDSRHVPTVLFLGRVTIQKGPEYFLEVARNVLRFKPNTRFIIAGSGDMLHYVIRRAAEMGISKNVLFAGFLRGKEVDRAYRMADVYVMPSVSEPFGIAPLEAMKNGVPVIISKTSGVSEVIKNCFKIDFWDINEMTNKIIALLHYKRLHKVLSKNGYHEVKRLNWSIPAQKVKSLYEVLL